ncbi:methyltransferase domain-containing protein [Gammaproteobacteria bacterium]|nr:methyltransferase domain-containing protein [Gammaproteobacteria bacterium]
MNSASIAVWLRDHYRELLIRSGIDQWQARRDPASVPVNCNLCGRDFHYRGFAHPEQVKCPSCASISRERLIIYWLLEKYGNGAATLNKAPALSQVRLLECSPRGAQRRREQMTPHFLRYLSSDYDRRAHRAEVQLDLTQADDIAALGETFDVIICAHVMEHIPDYRSALLNLARLLTIDGRLLLQVPITDSHYRKVTWDEFHGNQTRVFHRFSFDLLPVLAEYFTVEALLLAEREPLVMPGGEVDPAKYQWLQSHPEWPVIEIDAQTRQRCGLPAPEYCELFVLTRKECSATSLD